MPSKQKVSLAQLKVGVLGIVALSCVTLIIFLLTGDMQWFKKQIPLHLYTSDASGLNAGAPVRINGITAGKVDRVALSGETDPRRVIKVDFVVDEDMMKQIPNDSIASISSDNLLGSTKFLQINKGVHPELLTSGATVKSVKRAAKRATRKMRTGSSAKAGETCLNTFAFKSARPSKGSTSTPFS